MAVFLPDTSCLVALVCTWHEHHSATHAEIKRRQARGDVLHLAAHCLLESYSVLTRLPSPYRLSESDAFELLSGNWSDSPMIHLTGPECWGVLKQARDGSVSGGQIHDALIAASAAKAGCEVLLTWNVRHFERFRTERLSIQSPADR